ncbi:hypothetical protein [Rhizobium sp. BT03]|uniref:hypothetical protein n=1 Tax=Rhizobium sp. BT03 TaxID=3045156 RepID=UPI0024B3D592|nr:hypothetical protein [Rhizobium sp. BT03]WHO73030.1 hypothetical protein QMO80_002062 [Rhizobium sp. BT03]
MSLQDMMFSMLVCLKGRTGSAAALFRAELVARPLHLLIILGALIVTIPTVYAYPAAR